MSERKTIEEDFYSGTFLVEDARLAALIDWLQMKFGQIPEEFRASATFQIYHAEGDGDLEMSIVYDRPEADEELAKRIAQEERMMELARLGEARDAELYKRLDDQRRDIEIKALDRLLAKYPDYARESLQSLPDPSA